MQNGKRQIQSLLTKWTWQLMIANTLLSLAIALFVSFFVLNFITISSVIVPFVFIILFVISFLMTKKTIEEDDVIKFLNQSYPAFEESAHLIVKPSVELNSLEKLQLQKIEKTIDENIVIPNSIRIKLKSFSITLAAVIVFVFIVYTIPFLSFRPAFKNRSFQSSNPAINDETKLPEVKAVSVSITPPAYTHKSARTLDKFDLVAEQRSLTNWTIISTSKVDRVQFLFNNKTLVSLMPTDKKQTNWTVSKEINASGFYQLIIDGKASQLYTIEMIPDAPPTIVVTSPGTNTLIKLGDEKKVSIRVSLSDDYGIDSAMINATTASGSGEAITFKQLFIPFNNFHAGGKTYNLVKLLNLSAMNMSDGDELYFFISAKDNNGQQKRSDVYIVRLEDSAQLMSLAGMASGLDIKPELFRSERQIIIETEQLLKDKDTLTDERFKDQSDRLGTDQQLLRLRYGKYLGEETENEMIAQHDEKSSDALDFGNAAKVIDEYSDKHDAARDADFFDAPTKKQLQAMLTEMWKASLQLKTFKPKDALPFEYNALRLLKDLQQKTRAYVAKTGVQIAPLLLGKRLTGELDKIIDPKTKETKKENDSSFVTLREALSVLQKIKNKELLNKTDISSLQAASLLISDKAVSQPSIYLASFQSLQKILDAKYKQTDVILAGKGLQAIIHSVAYTSKATPAATDMGLSNRYFLNLKRQHE